MARHRRLLARLRRARVGATTEDSRAESHSTQVQEPVTEHAGWQEAHIAQRIVPTGRATWHMAHAASFVSEHPHAAGCSISAGCSVSADCSVSTPIALTAVTQPRAGKPDAIATYARRVSDGSLMGSRSHGADGGGCEPPERCMRNGMRGPIVELSAVELSALDGAAPLQPCPE